MEPTKESPLEEEVEQIEDGEEIQEPEDDPKLFETNWNEEAQEFEQMNLKKDLVRGIFGRGFVRPSKIQ